MITSTTTLVPDSPAAAYDAYRQAASAVFLAGTQGLKYRKEHYELAVDLSKAGLSYIEEEGDEIDIGAMTPLWQIKISPVIQKLAGGAVSRAISDIADKDIQRYGTLGGVISGKGAFSVLLPILLSLHVDVLLQDKGRMSLEDYLQCPPMGELRVFPLPEKKCILLIRPIGGCRRTNLIWLAQRHFGMIHGASSSAAVPEQLPLPGRPVMN